MGNNFGRDSELFIRTKSSESITIMEDSYFTAPLKIAKPFFDEKERILSIMVMSASAGIMEGDCYKINTVIGPNSRVALLGQSYNKIHKMKQGSAVQKIDFLIEEDAFFDYVQKPVIPFGDSHFKSSIECRLKRRSAFIYSDILACGRVKSGELFRFGEYANRTKVYYNEELIFYENLLLKPDTQPVADIGFFEGFTHQATLGFFCDRINSDLPDRLYNILKDIEEIEFGVTLTKKFGVLVRILGNSSDNLERCLELIRKEIYIAVE